MSKLTRAHRGDGAAVAVAIPTDPRQLLTTEQAAQIIGVSARTLWTLTKAGKVAFVRVGCRSIRYRQADLEAYIERSRVDGGQGDDK